MSKNTYWNRTGTYQAWIDNVGSKLVPSSGRCDTVEGELIRSATRLYYDFYNNGMCNNTSGAVKFIIAKLNNAPSIITELETIYLESNTGGYSERDISKELETVLDAVFAEVKDKRQLTPNTEDFFDYEDVEVEDEDDEFYEDDEE